MLRDAAGAAAALSRAAIAAESVTQLIDAAAQADRLIASLTGLRAQLLAQASGIERAERTRTRDIFLGRRALRAEVACALRVPERTAENLIGEAECLDTALPSTRRALAAGEISYRHAQVMIESTTLLDDATRASVEQEALPHAKRTTVATFRRRIHSLVERLAAESMPERHARAAEDREISYEPARNGMAWLTAYLPAAEALGAFNRLSDMADALRSPEEERTVAQLRADVFRDLILDGEIPAGGARGIGPTVFVTVPVLNLLGHSSEPAVLDGYGPIDHGTAHYLAAQAPSFTRILTHPATGTVLSVGRDSYRVPRDLRDWLRLRDRTCRFPGCSRDARNCDLDHTHAWASGGATRHDNLAHLCRGHHTLKHATRWRVANSRDGTLRWRSPGGSEYVTEPEVKLRV